MGIVVGVWKNPRRRALMEGRGQAVGEAGALVLRDVWFCVAEGMRPITLREQVEPAE